MELLTPSNYPALYPLLSDLPHDLAVAAVAAGDAAGRVYVDNPAQPTFALITPHLGRLYLLGRAHDGAASALHDLLHLVIRPLALAQQLPVFTVAHPPAWQPYIADVLQGLPTEPAVRQYYRWEGEPFSPLSLPSGFALAPVTRDLIRRAAIDSLHLLTEEMASERASVDDFLAHSFGLVALHDDELAGWCLSEYNTGSRCEVGIASLEPFQRLGLATAMGRAFLQMARAQGVAEVGWHCWKKNVPSAASALKIGLDFVLDYPVYFGWYNKR